MICVSRVALPIEILGVGRAFSWQLLGGIRDFLMAMVGSEQRRSMTGEMPLTTDVTIRSRAVRLLEYLEAVHGMREQPVRDIADYQDRCWWAGDIPTHPSCVLTATGDEPWLTVSKAPGPPGSARAGGCRDLSADRGNRSREGASFRR